MPRIVLRRHGSVARLEPEWMGGEEWDAYRIAIDGASYARDLRAMCVTLEKVEPILRRLRESDFDVTVEPNLRRELQRRTGEQWNDLKSAQERIRWIETEKGGHVPPYQRTGIEWLTLRMGALLADEMGTGKTLQAVVAIPANAPVLVVCTASGKGEWPKEIKKWRPHLKVRLLRGKKTEFRWPEPNEVVILNYDILPDLHDRAGVTDRKCSGKLPAKPCPGCQERVVFDAMRARTIIEGHKPECTRFLEPEPCPGCHPFLREAPEGCVVIFDEAHKLKNRKAQRTIRSTAISRAVQRRNGRCWELTGTPLENTPPELWAVLQVAGVAEEAFGNWNNFGALFNARPLPHGGFEWGMPGPEIKERLQRVSLRRLKADIMSELPEKAWKERDVEIEPAALRQCESFLKNSPYSLDEICRLLEGEDEEEAGAALGAMSRVRAALASAKIPAMLEFVEELEEQNEPLLVFSAHRGPIESLAKRPGWRVIMGGVSTDERAKIVTDFQEGRLKGLGLTIGAGGESMTLTRASQVLFVDRDYRPTANAQAEDRAHRKGQTRGVIITTLVANHALDARVTEILIRKMKLISASVDAAKDDHDAPRKAEEIDRRFEDYLHSVQEEIACGAAVRRMAETDDEKAALEALHECTFARPSSERYASQLGHDATIVGLSNAQWAFACRLAREGVPVASNEVAIAEILPAPGPKKGRRATFGEQRRRAAR